ncbi:unnamed protein product [Clonostachys chloroleuca]|uniref:DEAD/DEAH-box helicase domain-containing protein n=1 Tax=Clonostachys chloroleuca TaxID=1926264 RepID=A0AA35LRH9_9HYPO|nr:unnamed protein product [Clonostachys chloroleuca]
MAAVGQAAAGVAVPADEAGAVAAGLPGGGAAVREGAVRAQADPRRPSPLLFTDKLLLASGGEGAEEGRLETTKLSREMSREGNKTRPGMGENLTVSTWRHIAKGVGRQHLQGSERIAEEAAAGGWRGGGGDDDDDVDDDDDNDDGVLDLQAGHSSMTSRRCYAVERGVADVGGFLSASVAWHGVLGVEGGEPGLLEGLESSSLSLPPARWAGMQRLRLGRVWQGPDGVSGAHELPAPGGGAGRLELRRWQREALATMGRMASGRLASWEGDRASSSSSSSGGGGRPSDMLVVAGTGSGKSEVWMAAASANARSTTVVVAPLRALAEDVRRRLGEYGVSSKIWTDEGNATGRTSVIIVQPENLVREDWRAYARTLREERLVDKAILTP